MIASELINQIITPLKLEDRALNALNWFDEFRINQLPVVENDEFLGLVDEDVVFSASNPDDQIKDVELKHQDAFVSSNSHLFEVVKVALEKDIEVVGVLNENQKYIGLISVSDTIRAFAEMAATHYPGGILVLSMKETDYSLSEISRLAEAEGIRILSAFLSLDKKDSSRVKLTLKFNKLDLSRLIATFERFDYKIISQFQESQSQGYEKERLDILLKYLEI
jgi:Mg/Co/Ni transporter MgtE